MSKRQLFERRHYNWLADWVAQYQSDQPVDAAMHLAKHLEDAGNPGFDAERFLKRAKTQAKEQDNELQ